MSDAMHFLKLDGIDGSSTDDRHKGEIEVSSWSVGAANAGSVATGGGAGVGKVVVQDLHFTKRTDRASPKLFTACCTGEHVKSATLVTRRAGAERFEVLQIVLADVVVGSVLTIATDGVPTDQVTLRFGRIEYHYLEPKPGGGPGGADVIGGWDLVRNKRV